MMQATENLAINYTKMKHPDTLVIRPDNLGVGVTEFELDIERKNDLLESGRDSLATVI
jgi:hypothetical protein